ncbi:MAG: hypothetical protein LH473_07955 [Chitinophagales bacterium]|nr:hypothetical protein [Chitinophagales bacterium]
MKKIILPAILILMASFKAGAQEAHPLFKLNSISAHFKLIDPGVQQISFEEINSLAKDPSSLTVLDLPGYYSGVYNFSIQSADGILFESPQGKTTGKNFFYSTRFDLYASFNIYNKKKSEYNKNREVRLGIFYQPFQYQQSNHIRTDTITQDSFLYHYAYYEAYTPLLGIQGSYLFGTNPDHWISAYAGVGFGFGISFHPQVAETYGTMNAKVFYDSLQTPVYPQYNFSVLANTQNVYAGKSSILLEAKIPVGIDFKISKALFIFIEGNAVISKQIYLSENVSYNNALHFDGALGVQMKF